MNKLKINKFNEDIGKAQIKKSKTMHQEDENPQMKKLKNHK